MATCPRCGNLLREVLVTVGAETRTAVEACLDGCAGIWVGREDLVAGLQPAMSDDLLRVQEGTAEPRSTRWDFLEVEEARRCGPKIVLRPEQLEPYIRCVRCGREMDRYRWNMTSPVVLDECRDGHGIWIDAGEIMQMRQFFQADAADPVKRDDLRGRLAEVRAQYERAVPRDHPHRDHSPLGWLFGVLFDNDW
ncbi:MAG TPA: zf-TFIIB domain-containing protein [Armatimonadota bacterium]|nr:zf-TFIIB domain-containing protein [Armatimonadota bacterium]